MKIIRAWETAKNGIKYVYKNELGKKVYGEEKFEWFFYVKTSDYKKNESFFKTLESRALVNKYEDDGIYHKVFVDRSHNSEFLDKNNNFVWEFRDFNLNKVLALLESRDIQHYEADVPPSKRWILTNDIQFEDDLKVLFLDIETDDRNMKGQPIPGEFQILSFSIKDAKTQKMFHMKAEGYGDEFEKPLLETLLKYINAYDVVVSFNGNLFDFPYVKSRSLRHGLQIDWRRVLLQDHLEIFKKYGQGLQSYSLDNISKTIVGRGKVDHGKKIFQLFENDPVMLREYNNEDVQLMYDIEKKTNYLSVARQINCIGSCPADDRFITRKIDMMVLKQAMQDKHFHFKTKVRRQEGDEEEEKFTGAYVHEPITGLYRDVDVLDFGSLYPNCIKTYNISPDTLIEGECPEDRSVIISPSGAKFRRDIVGIFAKVITRMAENRKYYKKLMETVDPESEEHKTYDRLQYAFKSFGLSFYGAMGEVNTRFYDTRVAEAVTLAGQDFIKSNIDFLDKEGYKVIYSDTDSLFLCLNNKVNVSDLMVKLNKFCEYLAINRNAIKSTVEFAHDKSFSKWFICAKKRYAGYLTFLDGKYLKEPKLYVAGLEYKRTDVCKYVKQTQEVMVRQILDAKDMTIQEARIFIDKCKQYILKGDVKLEDITIGQKLTKDKDAYEQDTMHLAVVDEMIKDNKEVYVGDKILYFIESVGKGDKGVPRPIYKYKNSFARVYYWNKKIFPALERILEVVFPGVKWDSNYIGSKGTKKDIIMGRTDLWD